MEKKCFVCDGIGIIKYEPVICVSCEGKKCIQCNSRGVLKMPYDECYHCNGSGKYTPKEFLQK